MWKMAGNWPVASCSDIWREGESGGVCVNGGRKRVEGYVYMEGGREWRGMYIWREEESGGVCVNGGRKRVGG